MRFAAAQSEAEEIGLALDEIRAELVETCDPAGIDLVFLFTSGHAPEVFEQAATWARATFPKAVSVGCTCEGTIGPEGELERVHSVAVMAGELPSVRVRPVAVRPDELAQVEDWIAVLGVPPEPAPTFIVFADPFTFPIGEFLDGMNASRPGERIVGGMASGGSRPGENRLLADGAVFRDGLVGVALTGDVQVDTVVSQGCRPIGRTFIVTKGDGNVLMEIGGRKAFTQLMDVAGTLDPDDYALMRQGLFLGRAIDEYQENFERGDFLIQNVRGADPDKGLLAIAGTVKVGTTVQFHVRDADSADEDLREMLAARMGQGLPAPAAALVFSCNGRGTRMWDTPGHDAGVVAEVCGDPPMTGFFAAGELGPVKSTNFIHGLTASVVLIRPAS